MPHTMLNLSFSLFLFMEPLGVPTVVVLQEIAAERASNVSHITQPTGHKASLQTQTPPAPGLEG